MAFKLFDRVQETTTTTGTGDITLAGAVTGFSTFASRYSTGDTLYYGVYEAEADGTPNGAWEIGRGTYSAANTLTRTTVLSSSNSDALVNFAAGTKHVFVTMTALQGSSIRERVTSARTYYVRTDGSDSNNGLANTSGSAFLTIQKAIDVVSSTLDIASGIVATIQVADGTYTATNYLKQLTGPGTAVIQGNNSTPANVVISVTGAPCFSCNVSGWTVKDLKVTTTTSGWCIHSTSGNSTLHIGNIDFGASAHAHMLCDAGGTILVDSNYAITGAAAYHVYLERLCYFQMNSLTITITGTPAFSTAFAYARGLSEIYFPSCTFSGSATGKRYDISQNAVCFVNGGGANYFPGNSAGSTETGSQYG
jgi:hypothetical protein